MSFTVLPEGTTIYAPDELHRVVIQFPSADDAVVFHEFLRGFVNGEFDLTATEPGQDQAE